jgi:hypothetical protein
MQPLNSILHRYVRGGSTSEDALQRDQQCFSSLRSNLMRTLIFVTHFGQKRCALHSSKYGIFVMLRMIVKYMLAVYPLCLYMCDIFIRC